MVHLARQALNYLGAQSTQQPRWFFLYLGLAVLAGLLFLLPFSGAISSPLFQQPSPTPGAIQPPAGMVSWWPGDGNANDIKGTNHGTLQNGAAFAAGKVGQAFSFDGVDDMVQIPHSPGLTLQGPVTVELWASRTAFPGDWTDMVVKGGEVAVGLYHESYVVGFNPGNEISAGFTPADGSTVSIAGPVVMDSRFHHYAYVRAGNRHSLFRDGVEVAASVFTATPADTPGRPLTIGGVTLVSGSGFHFGGVIDEVAVFNRALSAAEIQAIYNAGSAGRVKPAPAATRLAFTVQPSNVAAGAIISPPVQVAVQDASGNTVSTATTPVTVAIGANPGGGILSGTLTVNAVNGVATFANLSIDKAGNGYILVASATGLTGANSASFNITTGAATRLAFTVQPSNVAAGAIISPPVQVAVQDASGNTVTTATTPVTLAIGANPGGGTLSGTTTVNAVNGVATFASLSIDKPGVGYTLVTFAAGLAGASSAPFSIAVGVAAKLAFTVQPGNATAGAAISPPVQVAVQDAAGNTVAAATNSVTIGIGTNPGGGTLSGTTTASAVNGVATFFNLSIDKAGNGYSLVASAGGLTGAASAPFNVTGGTSVAGGITISGTVTLQGRTGTFPAGVGHSIARVTLSPGGVTVGVSADGSFTLQGVAAGTYTLTASAAGYASRERTSVAVSGSPVSVPSVQMRCGLVDNNNFVNINDITATVASFGTTVAARVDAQGRFVDQNGDGAVNINDITCVVSNFGTTSPQPWP